METTITNFKNSQKREVLISYDCKSDEIRNELREILIEDYVGEQMNESLYKLGKSLNEDGIEKLRTTINSLLAENSEQNENNIVWIITPMSDFQFDYVEINNINQIIEL